MIYITMYLATIILANLSSAYFGPSASIVNAFLFIGLDLTARDRLHEAWHKNGLAWKMGLLIASGSLISWTINRNAGMIAIASFTAFALASLADTIVYQLLHNKSYYTKINGSNIVSAAIDSYTFPTIAFGGFMFWVSIGQFAAKVAGGAVWAYFLGRVRSNTACTRLVGNVRENVESVNDV